MFRPKHAAVRNYTHLSRTDTCWSCVFNIHRYLILCVFCVNKFTGKKLVFRIFVPGKSQLCKAIILQLGSFKITNMT